MIHVLSFTMKCMCHAPIPIACKLQNNLFNSITHCCFFFISIFYLHIIVIPTATHGEKTTQMFNGKVWIVFMHFFYHDVTFLDPILCNVFLISGSPRRADHRNAPVRLFSALASSPLLMFLSQTHFLLFPDTLSSIVRPHCLPNRIHYISALVSSHHWLTSVLFLIQILDCASSFVSSLLLLFLSLYHTLEKL